MVNDEINHGFPMANQIAIAKKEGDSTIKSPREGEFASAMKMQHTDSISGDVAFRQKNMVHSDATGKTPMGRSEAPGEKPIFDGSCHGDNQGAGKVESKTDWHHG